MTELSMKELSLDEIEYVAGGPLPLAAIPIIIEGIAYGVGIYAAVWTVAQ